MSSIQDANLAHSILAYMFTVMLKMQVETIYVMKAVFVSHF